MIHVIDNHLDAANRGLLETMFADRKRLFVDLFGWDVPVVDDQYEMDQFDNTKRVEVPFAPQIGFGVEVVVVRSHLESFSDESIQGTGYLVE